MNVSIPTEQVRSWLENLPSEKKPTVEALRRLIGSVAPEAHEIIYHDALGYGPTDSGFDRIVYITVFEKHLNLGFFFGGFLPDSEGLLVGSGLPYAPHQNQIAAREREPGHHQPSGTHVGRRVGAS